MPTKLSDIDPSELSLVRRGAVKRPWLFIKSETDDGEPLEIDAATLAALAKAHGIHPTEIAKALREDDAETEPTAEQIAKADADAGDEIFKADFTADQRRQMAANGEALPNESYPIPDRDHLERAIHAIGRGKTPHAQIKAHIVKRAKALNATDLLPESWNVQKEDGNMPDEAGTTVPVRKEDGTWDLSGVPEDSRTAFEAFAKAHDDEVAELRKQAETEQSKAEEALKIAKAERDEREHREYLAKAEELGQPAEFGEVMRAIAGSVDDDTFSKLEAVLKGAHEQAETAGLYAELGRGGVAKSDAESQLETKADEIRKADTSLSREQAYARALDENPDLYDRMEA